MPRKFSSISDTPSLFDSATSGLTVVRAQWAGNEAWTVEDLFQGYEILQALTYSTSLPLIARILPWFRQVDIVFGYAEIVPQGIADLMALQQTVTEQVQQVVQQLAPQHQAVLAALRDGTITFRTLTRHVSHKKTFLLSGGNRPPRVIVGSANLSTPGLGGYQWENLIVFDDSDAWTFYQRDWRRTANFASPIAPRVLLQRDPMDMEDIPVIDQVIQTRQAVVVEFHEGQVPEADMARAVIVRADTLRDRYRDVPLPVGPQGTTAIAPEAIQRIAVDWHSRQAAKAPDSDAVPRWEITWGDPMVCRFAGHDMDLDPDEKAVRHDAELLAQYFAGFDRFVGSSPGELQRQYYALLNWLFLAPALPLLRIQAIGHGHHGYLYPMTAIVYGKSNAGKTDFLKTVLRLMTGRDVLVPGGDFTKTAYASWAKRAEALPMVVDDIQRDRFQRHAVELIKSTDYFDNLPAPCLVFSANADIDGLSAEVTKRAYVVPIAASIPVSAAAKDRFTRQIQQQVGTALYRAYLGRVLPDLRDLAAQWDNPEPPDPYKTASSMLLEVLSEALGTTPPWARALELDDYIAAQDGYIRETLINLWQTRPQMFRIDRGARHLVLEASSSNELARWRKTIPSYLVIQQAQLSLILHLEETERFLGMRLNPRRWWQRR